MIIEKAYGETPTVGASEQTQVPRPENFLSGLSGLVPMLAIFVVFYFLLIRPQEKKRKQQEELIGGVKKGEEVVTSGGIFGKISKISEDGTVELEIADGVRIKALKSHLLDITSRKKEEGKAKGKK